MHIEINIFLDQRRLKEGLTQLKAYAEKINNWNIISSVDTLQTNYEYMLKYAAEGQADPQRRELFNDILKKAYELSDQLYVEEKFNNGYGYMATLYRNNKLKPFSTFAALQTELQELNAAEGNPVTTENNCDHESFSPHFDFVDNLFNKTILSSSWSSAEYQDACQLVYCGMSTFDLEVWMSGITLSLINCFDAHKFRFLIEIYLNKSILPVKARALVGIILSIYYYSKRIHYYSECNKGLDLLLNGNKKVAAQIHLIQHLFLLTRETAKIDKKMFEEIIPEMMKNPYLKYSDRKFDDIELKELEEDNPEWEENITKISEKIHELGELQREGADTYMSTFAMLKHYPFFNKLPHWFYPFTMKEPTVSKILKEKGFNEDSILYMMLKTPAFCNSDKYSFSLTLNDVPLQQIDMMHENINGKEEILKDQLGAPMELTEEERLKTIYRQYLHDLYRFCKLWSSRKEQRDIFKDPLTFWNIDEFHDLLIKGKAGIELANNLLYKGYYDEASAFYNVLLKEYPTDNVLIQKAGFALQKLGNYQEALNTYNLGYILKPQDTWTLKHIAHCYKKIHNDEKALEFFQLASKFDPDNLNITLQIGQCEASLGQFEEALKSFFKVEYLGKTPDNARRAIAWSYFMIGKYENASRFYEKIINETTPTLNDWINYGHVFLVEGNLKEAVTCYKKASKNCKTHEDFLNIFRDDSQILTDAGVDDTTLYIVQDLV